MYKIKVDDNMRYGVEPQCGVVRRMPCVQQDNDEYETAQRHNDELSYSKTAQDCHTQSWKKFTHAKKLAKPEKFTNVKNVQPRSNFTNTKKCSQRRTISQTRKSLLTRKKFTNMENGHTLKDDLNSQTQNSFHKCQKVHAKKVHKLEKLHWREKTL